MKWCYGCMSQISDEIHTCPYCGFMLAGYKPDKRALRFGTVLNGKYLLGIVLGIGGFGITYLAYDLNLQTKIAIKEFYPASMVERDTDETGTVMLTRSKGGQKTFQEGLKRYVEEASTLSRFFKLQGIVSVKDFFYENNTAYMVMEFVDGISLKKYVQANGNRLSLEEVMDIMEPLLQSLHVIHSAHVIHRDISPDNIMMDQTGQITLIDFGAASMAFNQKGRDGAVIVKHGYAPPEQYEGDLSSQGAWTDVYGICATMYRLLTGSTPPVYGERINGVKLRPIRKTNRRVPKNVDRAIRQGLSVEPMERQQSIEELYMQLYPEEKAPLGGFIKAFIIFAVTFLLVGGISIFAILKWPEEKSDAKVETAELNEENETGRTEEEPDPVENSRERDEEGGEEAGADLQQNKEENDEKQDPQLEQKETEWYVPEEENLHACIVVRDGILHNRNQSLTVGDILDSYYDEPGVWHVEETDSGVMVYYKGSKDDNTYIIVFQVFGDDTFKITGVMENGSDMSNYNAYIEQILDSVGA